MHSTSQPYLHFFYLLLVAAAAVIALVLLPLWGKRHEQPQIPWLIALSLALGFNAGFGALSIGVYDIPELLEWMRLRHLTTILAIVLCCGMAQTYFEGKKKVLMGGIALIYAIPVFYSILGNYMFIPQYVEKVIFPWKEEIFTLRIHYTWALRIHHLTGLSAMLMGFLFSIDAVLRTGSKRHIWLAIGLIAPVIVGVYANKVPTGLPITPLASFTILVVMLLPVFQELSRSDTLARELQIRELQIRGMALRTPGILYSLLIRNDGTRKFLFLSDRVLDILGFPSDHPDPMGEFVKGLSEEDLARYIASEENAMRNLSAWDFTSQFKRPDGKVIWFQGLAQVAKQPDGVVSNGVILDITGRIVQQQDRENLLSEVSLRKAELESFLFTLSHEMRTPLVNIAGFTAETLSLFKNNQFQWNEEIYQESIKNLQILVQNSNRLSMLISHLLEVGRHSRDKLHLSVVDAELVWNDACANYAWTELNMEVVKIAPLPPCFADATRLKIVFQKVLDNCVDYRKKGKPGRVLVESKVEGSEVTITIKDDGIGVDPQRAEYCFSPFMQMAPSEDHQGMGLPLARLLLRRMGGTITMDGELGVGSTVTIRVNNREESS